jgi:hypothetical protein
MPSAHSAKVSAELSLAMPAAAKEASINGINSAEDEPNRIISLVEYK